MKKKIEMFPVNPVPAYDYNSQDIPGDMFEVLSDDEKQFDIINRPSISYWKNAFNKIIGDPLAVIGFIIIFLMIILAVFGPMIRPYSYEQQDYTAINKTPNAVHWFGTDKFGRDLFVRIAYGARISLIVGFAAAGINMLIGVLYGGIAGYVGGTADMVMMRIVDIINAIPSLIYLILVMVFLGASVRSILIALCISYWRDTARMVRAQVLSLRGQDFAMAAKVVGESDLQILIRHFIPNSMGPIIVTVTFLIPQAIFYEAFLSFIGIGIAVPVASWGTLANESIANMRRFPHQMIFPTLAISLTMFALNFVGDGLRDALDPRLKK